MYLTEKLFWDGESGEQTKLRDNFHTILLARNMDGIREINELVSRSSCEDHFYYKPRISFQEFFGISKNVMKLSACLASPLNKLPVSHSLYERLVKSYDYLEIQPHRHPDQVAFNRHLADLSQRYGIPLVATTDTHSLDAYKAECRSIMQLAKHIEFADEDTFDLTYKSYDELVQMFREQDAIPEPLWMEAIQNTNRIADEIESFDLDTSFKYPVLYGEKDRDVLLERIEQGLQEKLKSGAIPPEQEQAYRDAIQEEMRVFDKLDMSAFMLFMSELVTWCKTHGIPVGPGRGSVGGSRIAYLIDIIDLNPERWQTIFSRFCNESRLEIGDIDTDYAPNDREKVYDYIINRFGHEKAAFILAIGTVKAKGCIDEICRALAARWDRENCHPLKEFDKILKRIKDEGVSYKEGYSEWEDVLSLYDEKTGKEIGSILQQGSPREQLVKQLREKYLSMKNENEEISAKNPWRGEIAKEIKKQIEPIDEAAKKSGNPGTEKYRTAFLEHPDYKTLCKKYPEVFQYFEGLLDVAISQSMHPAGIVASPITLRDNYGTFISDGKEILQIDMDCVHDSGLVKYDILGLKNIAIIRDAFELAGKPYPKTHEIDWDDQAVWKDMLRSPVGIFQMESAFAFSLLKKFEPKNIYEMALLNAGTRPAGESYRDELFARKVHKNPSPLLDELLKNSLGYLCFQEDTIRFLQEICGFSGSEADTVRRGIGRKKKEILDAAMPKILNGYCEKSTQPREVAEEEAKEFLKIIEDSSNYQFNYSHAVAYSMVGYLCAYLRYYYPYEFITAYLNNADNDDDVRDGSELAKLYGIQIIPPRFGISKDQYQFDREQHVIAKGLASVKYMNAAVSNELYELAQNHKPESFMDLLWLMSRETSLKSNQREILVKIDYFSEYGNAKELLRMLSVFQKFKDGEAKKVKKVGLSEGSVKLLLEHGTDQLKNGKTSDSITILDMRGLLLDLETEIRAQNIQDFDYKMKMQMQLDNLGYIDLTTGKPEDRRKLIITDIFPLRSKKTNEAWGYAVTTRSIGTGKEARLTVRSKMFDRLPLGKFDTIYAWDVGKERGYWYLNRYEKIY